MARQSTYSSRQYVCDSSISPGIWCGKRFERRHDLNRHVKVHQGRRDYECKQCGETFAQKNGLDVHERGHWGLRTHACPMSKIWGNGDCEVAPFRDDSSYRRHWQNKHAINPHRFECPKCDFKAARKALLKHHMRERHDRELPTWMQERQPRGAHGIDVPAHIPVTVFDSELPMFLGTSSRSRGRPRSSATRSSQQSSEPIIMRSPSYEGGELTPDIESASPSSSFLVTPDSPRKSGLPQEDPFSLRVPSLPPPSLWSTKTEMHSPDVWSSSAMAMPAPPMMDYPAPPITHETPMLMVNETPMMMDYRYSYPSLDPGLDFGVETDPYSATSSPASLVFNDSADMGVWGLAASTMDFGATQVGDDSWMDSMIDPTLLGQ